MQHLTYKELFDEGERLCKLGDCQNGIKLLEEGLNQFAGTYNCTIGELKLENVTDSSSLHMLSVIYNQMGNAYFYLRDYARALDYHTQDLELCERLDDAVGMAKACCNIGNTFHMIGDYDEAILYSLRNLELASQLNDKTGEARCLYNLGNIYHSKGKHMCSITLRNEKLTQLPAEIRETLTNAVHYYKQCLFTVSTSKDRSAEGRAYGQLGNTYYLLGEFESAIECHQARLRIAKEFGDKPAERRAYTNMGNTLTCMGRYNEAADHYMKAMNVARLMDDKAIEAQAYFSLGNVYSLLQDYSIAIDFHLRHLQIAIMLNDTVGQYRAYWSLGNIYAHMGELESAVDCAQKHLNLTRQVGDDSLELSAKMNLYELQKLLSASSTRDNESSLFTPISKFYGHPSFERLSVAMRKSNSIESIYTKNDASSMHQNRLRAQNLTSALNSAGNTTYRALSATNINQTGLSTAAAVANAAASAQAPVRVQSSAASALFKDNQMKMIDEDDDFSFLDTLSKIQSDRLDDQRCSIKLKPPMPSNTTTSNNSSPQATTKTKVSTSSLKENAKKTAENSKLNQDEFFNMLMKCQGSRLEDQRSSLALLKNLNHPTTTTTTINTASQAKATNVKKNSLKTSIDEAFFGMLSKVQSRRIDEQRTGIKTFGNKLKS